MNDLPEQKRPGSLGRNAITFVAFATAAALLNAVLVPGPLEQPYAEGFGRAVAAWGLAYLSTWFVERRRHVWLLAVATLFLIGGYVGNMMYA